MDYLFLERWSPYVVGGCIGLLNCLAFVLSDKPIGCSTAFARSSGMLEKILRGSKVAEKPYYRLFPPLVDWEWMLVIGVLIGSFVSAILSGQFHIAWVPTRWSASFGYTPFVRVLTALIGGIIMGFGARWAGGCTSGHGISGTMQLAVSSWLAAVCFFIGGIAAAMAIHRIIAM